MAERNGADQGPITIKKYANRRLYNTASSSYVTLEHLATMVKEGVEFLVYDAKTGEDITRSVLTQIIVEEESKGQTLLPIGFLRQLIGFYGDSLQSVLPRYLEHSMESFSRNQDQMRDYMKNALGGFFPFADFDKIGKQNMAMFESAMKMFAPGAQGRPNGTGENSVDPSAGAAPDSVSTGEAGESQVDALREQLEKMQRQIDDLSKGRG